MAPEVIRAQQTTGGWLKADVWSVGCTVLEMCTGKQPWSQYPHPMTAMFHIAGGETTPAVPPTVSEEARAFIGACLQLNPDDRPDVPTLARHPFLSGGGAEALRHRAREPTVQHATHRLPLDRYLNVPGMLDVGLMLAVQHVLCGVHRPSHAARAHFRLAGCTVCTLITVHRSRLHVHE